MSRSLGSSMSTRVFRKIRELNPIKDGDSYTFNRNPRNLEKLRIAYKTNGYHLDKPGRAFWHKLELSTTGRHISAQVKHFQNGPIISASTSEWAIKKQLFKTKDTAAFVNLARVLSARCLQSGISELACHILPPPNSKVEKFLKVMGENGISLVEPERFIASEPWDAYRPEKPWLVEE